MVVGMGRASLGLLAHAKGFCGLSMQSNAAVQFKGMTYGVRYFAASSTQGDKVAFISGGSRGLGLEYVKQLLQRDGQR